MTNKDIEINIEKEEKKRDNDEEKLCRSPFSIIDAKKTTEAPTPLPSSSYFSSFACLVRYCY